MTAALHIPEHATVAHLEGLLMRFPFSPRLRRKLAETRRREEQEARSKALKQIRAGIMSADLRTLQALVADLQEAGRAN
jgi:hypothetical protein